MPYKVAQCHGQHKTAIDRIVAAHKAGQVTEHEAWVRLSILYHRCNNRLPPEMREDTQHRRYMIETWFPTYANLWFEGSREDCKAMAGELEAGQGGKFWVVYEY